MASHTGGNMMDAMCVDATAICSATIVADAREITGAFLEALRRPAVGSRGLWDQRQPLLGLKTGRAHFLGPSAVVASTLARVLTAGRQTSAPVSASWSRGKDRH